MWYYGHLNHTDMRYNFSGALIREHGEHNELCEATRPRGRGYFWPPWEPPSDAPSVLR